MKSNNKFIQALKSTAKLAAKVGDNVTRKLLEKILKDEEHYENKSDKKLNQSKPIGV